MTTEPATPPSPVPPEEPTQPRQEQPAGPNNVYAFRQNYSIPNLEAQTVGDELARIRNANGGQLTPALVVQAATDPNNPLHAGFEWNNDVAAHYWRITQARRMIVSIRVLNSPVVPARASYYVSVQVPDSGRQYIPTVQAMSDEQLRARVLNEVITFIESLRRRYGHFQECAELIDRLQRQAG